MPKFAAQGDVYLRDINDRRKKVKQIRPTSQISSSRLSTPSPSSSLPVTMRATCTRVRISWAGWAAGPTWAVEGAPHPLYRNPALKSREGG